MSMAVYIETFIPYIRVRSRVPFPSFYCYNWTNRIGFSKSPNQRGNKALDGSFLNVNFAFWCTYNICEPTSKDFGSQVM